MASTRRYKYYFDYLSGRAEYLFIHIPKNAGVSIKRAPMLQGRLIGAEPWFYRSKTYYWNLLQSMKANNEHHGIGHARLLDIHPNVRNRLIPIAVIRNPWSRVVSRYRFGLGAMDKGDCPPDYSSRCFEEFLEERHLYGNKKYYWHRAIRGWFSQYEYVVDESDRIEPHILRQERLDTEAKRYFGLSDKIGRRNVSPGSSRPYQDYYNPKTIQIVADWYAKDINKFGFDFDSTAKNNCYYDYSPNRALHLPHAKKAA